jgi:acetoin utilization protein AcuA
MAKPAKETVQSTRGPIEVRSYVTPEDIESCELDEGIGVFPQYRSLLTSKKSLKNLASEKKNNLCLCVDDGNHIVGYCVRRQPPSDERWAEMDPPLLYEVLGENARGWRNHGLMKPMLRLICNEPENEERILYIVGYTWTWDMEETHKTLQEYRDTIIHLLTPYGFKQYPTNEPNVSLRAENLFMARIGEEIERPVKRNFTNLLFGIKED